MNTVEILKAARAKIEDPAHWTQGYFAYNANHEQVHGNDTSAVCYCGIGAIEAATGVRYFEAGWAWRAADALYLAAGLHFPLFNDSHTHAEVLDMFDRAIAAEEVA